MTRSALRPRSSAHAAHKRRRPRSTLSLRRPWRVPTPGPSPRPQPQPPPSFPRSDCIAPLRECAADHDSGDLLADVSFITRVAAAGHVIFNISFNTSVVTRYCVQRLVPPTRDWADYVSCNGPYVEDYTCECNNWCVRRAAPRPCLVMSIRRAPHANPPTRPLATAAAPSAPRPSAPATNLMHHARAPRVAFASAVTLWA
jgi:hypothetical protein